MYFLLHFQEFFRKDKRFFFPSNSPQICNQLASEKILLHNFTTCRNQVEGTNHFLNIQKQNHRNYKLLYQLWLQKDISQYIQIFYLRMLLERKNLHRHPLLQQGVTQLLMLGRERRCGEESKKDQLLSFIGHLYKSFLSFYLSDIHGGP